MPENKTKTTTKKVYTSKDSVMYKGYGKGVGGSSLGSNVPIPKKTDPKHAPGSYGYSKGTAKVTVKKVKPKSK